jgi:uncharacterized protein
MKGKDGIRADCARARDLMTKAIAVVRDDLRQIYKSEKDPLSLIKLKDIYDRFDAAAHDYQRFTDTIQNIVARNM